MAKIDFYGTVLEFTKSRPGEAAPFGKLKAAESGKKLPAVEGEKTEYAPSTFRTLLASRFHNVDLTAFKIGDRVKITGTEFMDVSTDQTGKKWNNLTVWVDSIVPAEFEDKAPQAPTLADEVPF